ncbi:MAG TPA: tRNA lysidine(34) synthetase TilS [Gemmatimonadota bacterium]|nr:tRNA lysidine(34) synthetase TilS [Gemmatimonadota bacterium]
MPRPTHDLAAAFREHWMRHFAPPAGAAIVAAVSGGLDSMTLLALLARQRVAGDLEVVAAHYDHGTRGSESADDGRFVEAVSRRWGVRAVRGRGNAPARAKTSGRGPQAAARDLRYAFLRDVVERAGASALVTAHQRDDRVETVLLRLVRGTSPDGLAAMAPITERGGMIVLRPFLPFSRAAIAGWAAATGVPYREDPSNRAERYPRSRVRHELRPLLAALNPRLDEAIVRLSAQAAADAAYLRQGALGLLNGTTIERTREVWRLDARGLLAAPAPLLSRALLEAWAWSAPSGAAPPGAEWVAGAIDFLRSGRGGRLPFPGGGRLRRSRGRVELEVAPGRARTRRPSRGGRSDA